MSQLVVEVCKIEETIKHPNADRLCIAKVKGWNTCIGYNPETDKADFEVGNKVVFFPPDSILPPELANGPDDEIPGRLNVMKYLVPLSKNEDGIRPSGGRVRATRLRGVPSYGVIMALSPDDPDWEVGTDVAEHFGINKWEPPLKCSDGDAEREHIRFHKYTEIESYGNFPDAIPENELVVIKEKLHGSNCRVALVLDKDEKGNVCWVWMAGSHEIRRKPVNAKNQPCMYWEPLTDKVKEMLEYVRDIYAKFILKIDESIFSVVMYCEIYGSGIQDLAYGYENGQHGFRAFDLSVNGQYMDYHHKTYLFNRFEIEQVPFLYRGKFTSEIVEQYTSGPTIVCDASKAGKFKGREGIVITPIKEQICSSGKLYGKRMILKSVSADYLGRRGAKDKK